MPVLNLTNVKSPVRIPDHQRPPPPGLNRGIIRLGEMERDAVMR